MIKAGIIGGTGYTGVELLRLLHNHPEVEVVAISSRSLQGKKVGEVFPSLINQSELVFSLPDDAILSSCDVIFFATPHGVAMEGAGKFIDQGIKVVDLGADFRINDATEWSKWYNMEHTQAKLLESAVYGIPEHNRAEVKEAMLLANPGCYPTAVQLALKPLIENQLISLDNIVADCKSGVSGAGRGANQAMLLCETSESFKAYGVGGHRHFPEIKQQLELFSGGAEVGLTFVPHLVPMIRGIHATLYMRPAGEVGDLQALYEEKYRDEPFVDVLLAGSHPETRTVRGNNTCRIAIHQPEDSGLIVVLSVIDNLVKGASGQAVQNMNIMFGFGEKMGLDQVALMP